MQIKMLLMAFDGCRTLTEFPVTDCLFRTTIKIHTYLCCFSDFVKKKDRPSSKIRIGFLSGSSSAKTSLFSLYGGVHTQQEAAIFDNTDIGNYLTLIMG